MKNIAPMEHRKEIGRLLRIAAGKGFLNRRERVCTSDVPPNMDGAGVCRGWNIELGNRLKNGGKKGKEVNPLGANPLLGVSSSVTVRTGNAPPR